MGGGHVRVDIALGGAEFGVTHHLLDDGWSDVAQRQCRGGSVPTGVRIKVSCPASSQRIMEGDIEAIFVHAQHLPDAAVGALAQIEEHRRDDLRVDDGRILSLFGFESAAANLGGVPVDHVLLQPQQLSGHHAGVDHQQDKFDVSMDALGKTVFLTREDAEAALEQEGDSEQ